MDYSDALLGKKEALERKAHRKPSSSTVCEDVVSQSSEQDFIEIQRRGRKCKHCNQKSCRLGQNCKFSHKNQGPNAREHASGPIQKEKTNLCFNFMNKGQCQYGSSCRYSHDKSKYKTAICKYWEQGEKCPHKSNCQYAHGEEELRVNEQPINVHHKESTLCNEFVKSGQCNYGTKCRYSHDTSKYKTVFCKYWKEGKKCKHNEHCQFAHGYEELRGKSKNIDEEIKLEVESPQSVHEEELPTNNTTTNEQMGKSEDDIETSSCSGNQILNSPVNSKIWNMGWCPYGNECLFVYGDRELGRYLNTETNQTQSVFSFCIQFVESKRCIHGSFCTLSYKCDQQMSESNSSIFLDIEDKVNK